MEITPALIAAFLAAIAGPVGVTLGWWLGRRAERDRTAREERKSAYVGFTTAAINYRNADDEERRRRRNERWEAFAVLTLVAPPEAVRRAAYLVAVGDRLLESALGEEVRRAIYAEAWVHIREFTRLARIDLKVGETEPFAALTPVTGERLSFERPTRPD